MQPYTDGMHLCHDMIDAVALLTPLLDPITVISPSVPSAGCASLTLEKRGQ